MTIPILVTIAALLVAFLFLRLRFQLELSEQRRWLFFGLGRSGLELDLKTKERILKFMGLPISRSQAQASPPLRAIRPERARSSKKFRWLNMRSHFPQLLRAALAFFSGLWKSTKIEKCEGELTGGFSSPDITGQLFGYYQAAAAAIPGGSRFVYRPSWFESPFTGRVQLIVALPLYALIYRLLVLIVQLPKRALVRVAIHKKKGTHNG